MRAAQNTMTEEQKEHNYNSCSCAYCHGTGTTRHNTVCDHSEDEPQLELNETPQEFVEVLIRRMANLETNKEKLMFLVGEFIDSRYRVSKRNRKAESLDVVLMNQFKDNDFWFKTMFYLKTHDNI